MTETDISRLPTDPASFLSPFDAIVLVANSQEAATVLSASELGQRPLFIFFNRVYRIIDKHFDRDCLLVSRSSPVGASLVYRKELDDVLALLKGPRFHGIVNIRARDREILSKPEDFQGNPVAFLDLYDWSKRIYPMGQRIPSTGFALAVWLAQQKLPIPIYLAGFSGVREMQWRVYDGHDWTWEQLVLNLLYKKDLLRNYRVGKYFDNWPTQAIMSDFPEITADDISTTAVEVLSHRLSGTNRVIDHIYSSLRLQLAVRDFLRWMRPQSKKEKTRERLLAQMGAEQKG